MKRNSIIRQAFAAIFILFVSAAFINRAAATPENVDAKILSQFSKTYATAENVTWKQTKDYSKASFIRNNKRMEVFYNNNDELICTSTYMDDLSYLPDATLATIQDRYNNYRCISALKCVNADGTTQYYIQLENDKKSVILQSDTDGYTTVFKTIKK